MELIATAMVSSLGYDASTACAAARAGLTRAAELPFAATEGDGSPGLAIGHPVALLGGGFEGDGRLMRLLEGALRDLATRVSTDLLSTLRLGFYLALPASDRQHQGLNLVHDEGVRSDYLEQIGEPVQVDEVARARRVISTAMSLAEFPESISPSLRSVRVSVSGHAAVFELCELAQGEVDSGAIELAIVGGVDSLVSQATLAWLQLTQRLKGGDSPAGLSPGEAAALLIFGDRTIADRISCPARAQIQHVVRASSPAPFFSGEPGQGQGQFEVLGSLVKEAADRALWCIVDQNGEVYRANDWGHALVRLQAQISPDSVNPEVWFPVASFGDTGAASGAVAVCMASRAYARGYAPTANAIVLTNSDGPDRAGCLLSATEN